MVLLNDALQQEELTVQMVSDFCAENNRTSSVSTVQRAAHDDDDADDSADINQDDHSESGVPFQLIYCKKTTTLDQECGARGLTVYIYFL